MSNASSELPTERTITDPQRELELHGLYVDEALYRLDQFLNDAFVAGFSEVRIIHGKGTGALRQAVRDALRNHPLVKAFRSGLYGEGESGVTVVQLTER